MRAVEHVQRVANLLFKRFVQLQPRRVLAHQRELYVIDVRRRLTSGLTVLALEVGFAVTPEVTVVVFADSVIQALNTRTVINRRGSKAVI